MFVYRYAYTTTVLLCKCILFTVVIQISKASLPRASELPGLIPNFLEERVVLYDDGVLDVGALRGRVGVSVVYGRYHAAATERDIERSLL